MKKLSAIRATVRQFIRDEFSSAEEYDFQEDEIDLHIADCLTEISERRPCEVKETLTTTADSKDLDISSIEDLLEVLKIEYPTGEDPPAFRNCSIFGNTLTMAIDSLPSADENVFLYCYKVHQLTEDTSTLNPQLERVLVAGAVPKLALSWINGIRGQVKEAIALISSVHTSIGNMAAKITAAGADLTTGIARLTQAKADLTTGRPLIVESRATAKGIIDGISGVTGGITKAKADLTTGRALGFNKVYVGGRPLTDLANYAARELSIALTGLNQASSYLSVDTPAGQYGNYSAREVSNAIAHGNYAARELSIATTSLNQAGGYTRELMTRLSIAGVINSYQTWANNKLILYYAELKRLVKPKTYTRHLTS